MLFIDILIAFLRLTLHRLKHENTLRALSQFFRAFLRAILHRLKHENILHRLKHENILHRLKHGETPDALSRSYIRYLSVETKYGCAIRLPVGRFYAHRNCPRSSEPKASPSNR